MTIEGVEGDGGNERVAQGILLLQKAESAGCSNVPNVAPVRELDLEGLAANERVREIDA